MNDRFKFRVGLGQAMLSMALTGKYKTAYGFEWEYENNIHENTDLHCDEPVFDIELGERIYDD